MRATPFIVTCVGAALLTAGCATSDSGQGGGAARAGERDAPASVAAVPGGPSAVARMICSDEVAAAVKSLFAMPQQPARTHSWSDQTYRCDYRVGSGTLHLSVKDQTGSAGSTFFTALRARLPGATPITGAANFGFPAFRTPDGSVAFLKDGKTLLVDASSLPDAAIPAELGRQGAASSTAAAVLECWTE